MSDAVKSQGSTLEIQQGTSPATWLEVKEVTNFQGFDGQAAEIDVTHMKSPAKEYLPGLQDFGNFQLDVNYLPDDPGQEELRDAKASGEVLTFRLTLSEGTIYTWDSYVMSSPISAGVDAKVDGSFQLRVTGDVVKS